MSSLSFPDQPKHMSSYDAVIIGAGIVLNYFRSHAVALIVGACEIISFFQGT